MGNGAKAQQKRERNADKNAKGGKSQLKVNEASKSIVCMTCRQPFMNTARAPALEAHATEKHDKTIAECFPTFTP
ncbi:At2g23090 like protein [Coprinopsis sp. MPI-PUGE-AT-0042]|nr:At2g23090 like protein [Coprinopsis sp. MPI-PUGE-AT-0042]